MLESLFEKLYSESFYLFTLYFYVGVCYQVSEPVVDIAVVNNMDLIPVFMVLPVP